MASASGYSEGSKRNGQGAGFDARAFPGKRLHVRAIVRDGRRAFVGSQSLRKLELDERREVGSHHSRPCDRPAPGEDVQARLAADDRIEASTTEEGGVMISTEPRADDAIVDVPGSWWREHRHVAVWILVAAVIVFFLRFAAEAVVPFVLSGMLFYALDPAVDALQRWRIPRAIGAALMLGLVLTGVAAISLTLRDDIAKVVTDLPDGARRLRTALQTAKDPRRWIP